MKQYTFYVSGAHCSACRILLEDTLNEQTGIENTYVDLKNSTISFETALDNSGSEIAEMLNEKIKHNGYTISTKKITKND